MLCEYYTAKRGVWQGETTKNMKKISGSVIAGDIFIRRADCKTVAPRSR